LLDSSTDKALPIRFFEKNYSHDQVLSPALFRLRSAYKGKERGWIAEQLHAIAERLLKVHTIVSRETERLHNVRPATREELYRRACRARDYASAMFAHPVTLAELARIACLSPNHLLRTFRQVFRETPHQFLTNRRLQEAKRLLARDNMTVTEICLAVGFESPGSFSTLFRTRFGVSPSQWRNPKK
jgi:AraC-like DNA-binding protein